MRWSILAAMLAAFAGTAAHADEISTTIPTRPGVTESFLADFPAHPLAAAILFPGGDGHFVIHREPDGSFDANRNFLSRTRKMFAAAGIATLLLDTPSDRPDGIGNSFRQGRKHAQDVAAAIAWLQQQTGKPVWLVGTSMGTISAAANAIRLHKQIAGLVITSSISAPGRVAPDAGLAALDLSAIDVPVLVMDDTLDACRVSPPGNAPVLAKRMTASPRVATVLIQGGSTPLSADCDALSYHGYFGVEGQAVDAMTKFILAK